MKEMLKCTNVSLETLTLEIANLPLSMSIYIFANSILDTIIQDGYKRERSNNNIVKSKI